MVVCWCCCYCFFCIRRYWERGSTNHSSPAFFRAQPIPLLQKSISPQWLSKRKRLYTSVPWRVAWELVSLIGFHTMPGKHSRPTSIDFVGSRVHACLAVTCHLYSWQNGWDLLSTTAVIWDWNAHRIRVISRLFFFFFFFWRIKFSAVPVENWTHYLSIKIPELY